MRTRINNITFTPDTRSINTGITDLTIDDIRLFINESQMKVICSSMQKDNIVSISSGVVTYKDTFPVLAVGDHITFEIDRGDDIAKETNATANKQAVLSAIEQAKTALQGNDQAATLAALKTAIAAIDVSDLAKEATLNSVRLDAAAAKIAAQSITGYALQGSDSTATNTGLKDILNTISTNMYKGVPAVSQSGNATISPNVWNVWQSVATDLTITKGNDILGIVNEYIIRLTLDSSWVEGTNTITFNGFALEWNGGSVPTWTAGHIYEISIVDNIALWADITPAS